MGDKNFAGRAAALQAFSEYYPTPDRPNSAGIWHSFDYAQAEFFMLDVRSQADPRLDPDGPAKSMLDGDNIPNGQLAWLKQGLLNSTATWKFIVSGVTFNPGTKPYDAWGGYQRERQEILDFIRINSIEGVIIISGDLHTGGALDDGTNAGLPEVSVPHTNLPVSNPSSGIVGVWSEGYVSGVGGDGYTLITVGIDGVRIENRGVNGAVRQQMFLETAASGPAAGLLGEYFNAVNLTKVAGTRIDPTINFRSDWGPAPPGTVVNPDDVYSVRWTGFVETSTAGTWTFFTTSNDGVRLWVNNTQIINNWTQHSVVQNAGTITLSAGWHALQLEYFQQAGVAEVTLSFQGPGQAKTIIPQSKLRTEMPDQSPEVLFRINAGGGQIVADPTWAPDTSSNPSTYNNVGEGGNSATFVTTASVNTTDPSIPSGTPMALFQTERYDNPGGAELVWDFPIAPGQYFVRLYFAETYSGAFHVGARIFDVKIEGVTVLNDYDIADVGADKGVVKSFTVAADSNLDIDFMRVVQNPAIKGIEVLTVDALATANFARTATGETIPSVSPEQTAESSASSVKSSRHAFRESFTASVQPYMPIIGDPNIPTPIGKEGDELNLRRRAQGRTVHAVHALDDAFATWGRMRLRPLHDLRLDFTQLRDT